MLFTKTRRRAMWSVRPTATPPPIDYKVGVAVRLLVVLGVASALVGLLPHGDLGGASAVAVSATDVERRLEEARQQLESVHDRIGATRRARDERAADLADIRERLRSAVEAVRLAEAAVDRQHARVLALRDDVARAETARRRAAERAGDRAAALYRRGPGRGVFGAIAAAADVEHLAERTRYAEAALQKDRAAFEAAAAAEREVDALRRHVVAEERVLADALDAERRMVARMEALRESREVALADVEAELDRLLGDEAHRAEEVVQLERALARAGGAVSQGASRSGSGPSVATAGGGGWTWPARGTVSSRFGWRWGRQHQGVDIAAPHGAAIVAARGGRVSHAGSMSGYGNVVMLEHGGGVTTVYAHMSRIRTSVGAAVAAGARIGDVGCSGRCTGPHLHFEVRVGGAARDPQAFLP